MFNERYPYSNFHGLNLDWILEEIRKLWTYITVDIEQHFSQYIKKLFVNMSYSRETETITFEIEEHE